jgi:hypothetical protein
LDDQSRVKARPVRHGHHPAYAPSRLTRAIGCDVENGLAVGLDRHAQERGLAEPKATQDELLRQSRLTNTWRPHDEQRLAR